MSDSTESERRWAHTQALASTHLSGHEPTQAFLADCEAVIKGAMTHEQASANSLARALAKDRAARNQGTTPAEGWETD